MKTFFRILLSFTLIICVLTLPQKLYASLNTDIITDEILSRREKYFYGTITLWQIDCFEGGTGSRATWLKEQSYAFEKRHNGVYIAVETVSPERAEILLKTKKPDIISFSSPIKIDNTQSILFEEVDFRTDLQNVIFDDAVPWCFGSYCFFEGEEERAEHKIAYTNKNGYSPLKAISEFNVNNKQIQEFSKQYEAFNAYANKSISSLLGTQRDLYRLKNLKENREGNISVALYSDLIQYFSVFNQNNDKKTEMINKYISFILSTNVQNNIANIGLFPVNLQANPQYDNVYTALVWEEIKTKQLNFACTVKNN